MFCDIDFVTRGEKLSTFWEVMQLYQYPLRMRDWRLRNFSEELFVYAAFSPKKYGPIFVQFLRWL